MNRTASRTGGKSIGQIVVHGIESDLIRVLRADATCNGPVMDALWARRCPS